ncbi:hypothetical protein CAEBREN_02622 [Caenorhabditis brenneri]|uniref:Uncharacterized protein n=1 Tax=Caenorhabditis brenneri TaxID=135651 RepID=G0NKX5_CAEBE|nr:hypothetical protein CAEBREN_02622 [Caenorhabditis brenneri]
MSTLRRWRAAERNLDGVRDIRRGETCSDSMKACQWFTRLSLAVFAFAIVGIYLTMFYKESVHRGLAPYHRYKFEHKCFSSGDDFVNTYMRAFRYTDFAISVLIIIPCVLLCVSNKYPIFHWVISITMVIRFVILMIEIVHMSSFRGDTQLYFLIVVYKGQCDAYDVKSEGFQEFVTVFALRMIKGGITVLMGLIAYGNTLSVHFFGLQPRPRCSKYEDPIELDEYPIPNVPRGFIQS